MESGVGAPQTRCFQRIDPVGKPVVIYDSRYACECACREMILCKMRSLFVADLLCCAYFIPFV